jgi:hypothetical protein
MQRQMKTKQIVIDCSSDEIEKLDLPFDADARVGIVHLFAR